jgi:hypothetical protein
MKRETIAVALLVGSIACSEGSSNEATSSAGAGASGAGGQAQGGDGGVGGQGGDGKGGFAFGGFAPIPVRELPGLESITFWERTGGTAPTDYTFAVNGAELTTRLDDPLDAANQDVTGTSVEFYDVYYSDGVGAFDIDGSYLTISGVFPVALPAGGGLNLAEIGLNFSDASTEYGNYVASFVALGDNADATLVGNCIDGDLQTHTVMGNTVGSNERLRLTLGFASTSGPPR